MPARKSYHVTDGELVLKLTVEPEGGYMVTCPMDPAVITQAETLEEAFEMARDAIKTLADGRRKERGQVGSLRQRRRTAG